MSGPMIFSILQLLFLSAPMILGLPWFSSCPQNIPCKQTKNCFPSTAEERVITVKQPTQEKESHLYPQFVRINFIPGLPHILCKCFNKGESSEIQLYEFDPEEKDINEPFLALEVTSCNAKVLSSITYLSADEDSASDHFYVLIRKGPNKEDCQQVIVVRDDYWHSLADCSPSCNILRPTEESVNGQNIWYNNWREVVFTKGCFSKGEDYTITTGPAVLEVSKEPDQSESTPPEITLKNFISDDINIYMACYLNAMGQTRVNLFSSPKTDAKRYTTFLTLTVTTCNTAAISRSITFKSFDKSSNTYSVFLWFKYPDDGSGGLESNCGQVTITKDSHVGFTQHFTKCPAVCEIKRHSWSMFYSWINNWEKFTLK